VVKAFATPAGLRRVLDGVDLSVEPGRSSPLRAGRAPARPRSWPSSPAGSGGTPDRWSSREPRAGRAARVGATWPSAPGARTVGGADRGPRTSHSRALGKVRGAGDDPLALMRQLAVDQLADRHPSEISLGEQQRASVARRDRETPVVAGRRAHRPPGPRTGRGGLVRCASWPTAAPLPRRHAQRAGVRGRRPRLGASRRPAAPPRLRRATPKVCDPGHAVLHQGAQPEADSNSPARSAGCVTMSRQADANVHLVPFRWSAATRNRRLARRSCYRPSVRRWRKSLRLPAHRTVGWTWVRGREPRDATCEPGGAI
jgi:hypothetical protein